MSSLDPTLLVWAYRAAVLVHIAGAVVWFGAVAYYLFVLKPAMAMAELEREVRYRLLVAIKHRLRRVVGVALVALVASGLFNAWVRGYLGGAGTVPSAIARLFAAKMVIVVLLVIIFIFALPLLARVQVARWRGRLFNLTHVIVLILGALAAAAGVVMSR